MAKVDSLVRVLRRKKTVITRAFFWKIPHHSDRLDVRLKLGRYRISADAFGPDELDCDSPKSELTLDDEEFKALIKLLQEEYAPFREGVKAFIPVDQPFTSANAEQVKKLFSVPNRRKLVEFILQNNVIPEDVSVALENLRRTNAVRAFQAMLREDLVEANWQGWFEANSWVLGSEFVRVLDERHIDPKNISDFLMQAYDGFLDVVEIKRPGGDMSFWSSTRDHGNLVPSPSLTKAVSQATRYIFEIEREANSVKFMERLGGVRTVKPRGILVFGRSHDWGEAENEAYRILNSSYHNLTIMTYDHVLVRAQRMIGHDQSRAG